MTATHYGADLATPRKTTRSRLDARNADSFLIRPATFARGAGPPGGQKGLYSSDLSCFNEPAYVCA